MRAPHHAHARASCEGGHHAGAPYHAHAHAHSLPSSTSRHHPCARNVSRETFCVDASGHLGYLNQSSYLCNYDKYNDISNYRIDRMIDVRILDDEPAKPFESLTGASRASLDLPKYMDEHVYMYSSPNTRCTFRITHAMISDVIDMFGSDVTFGEETSEYVTASARVNERAMWQFAKNFAPDVLILGPKRLADQVVAEAETHTDSI